MKSLVKYNFQEMLVKMLPFYGVLIAVSLLRLMASFLASSFDIAQLFEFGFGLLFTVVAIVVLVWAQFVSVVLFYKKMTKDEGYLIHMLPVRQSSIVLSYVISAVLIVILSLVAVGLCLFLTIEPWFYTDLLDGLNILISQFFGGTIVFSLVFNGSIGMLGNLMICYLAIMLGQTRNRNRLLYMVAFGLIISVGISILSFIPLLLATWIDPLMSLYSSLSLIEAKEYLITVFFMDIGFNLIVIILCYLGTVWLMKNKLNLQ